MDENNNPIQPGELSYPEPVKKKSVFREYTESIIIAVLLALVIRTFLIQAFKIPSGSMEDTLLVGDHLLVCKFIYGTKIPFTGKSVLTFRDPRQGDVIVFEYPPDTRDTTLSYWKKRDFIKRVVGEPGDTVEVKNKKLMVNGKLYENPHAVFKEAGNILEKCPDGAPQESPCWRDSFGPFKVPDNSYFVMGDNRDRSFDSRFWGVVPRENIRGLACIKYWSWDSGNTAVRWKNIGRLIH